MSLLEKIKAHRNLPRKERVASTPKFVEEIKKAGHRSLLLTGILLAMGLSALPSRAATVDNTLNILNQTIKGESKGGIRPEILNEILEEAGKLPPELRNQSINEALEINTDPSKAIGTHPSNYQKKSVTIIGINTNSKEGSDNAKIIISGIKKTGFQDIALSIPEDWQEAVNKYVASNFSQENKQTLINTINHLEKESLRLTPSNTPFIETCNSNPQRINTETLLDVLETAGKKMLQVHCIDLQTTRLATVLQYRECQYPEANAVGLLLKERSKHMAGKINEIKAPILVLAQPAFVGEGKENGSLNNQLEYNFGIKPNTFQTEVNKNITNGYAGNEIPMVITPANTILVKIAEQLPTKPKELQTSLTKDLQEMDL